jgi:KDO2-lipid IV(A) lauroyltransferase
LNRKIEPQYYYRHFLHPKYWPTWLLIGVLRLIAFLPYGVIQSIGTALGKLFYKVGGSRRRISEKNIVACFPEFTPEEQTKLVIDSFIATAKGYVESTLSWWGNMQPYLDNLEVHGLDHFEAAKKQGKGVLILGAHFSILDFAQPLVDKTFGFNYMYRPNNNKLFDAVIERSRAKYNPVKFDKKHLKEMIEFIKEGGWVWYGCDQDFGKKNSVFAPFFGIQAATLTTPAWIARETGAPVIALAQFREGYGRYSIRFSPVLDNFPTEDEEANAAQFNKILEDFVRLHPEQYLWMHRRFKTRPEGEPSFY